jgi:hypothetical protein
VAITIYGFYNNNAMGRSKVRLALEKSTFIQIKVKKARVTKKDVEDLMQKLAWRRPGDKE